MKLDHIAYRVRSRDATVWFFKSLDYEIEEEFQIDFDDGSKAECMVMAPTSLQLETHEEAKLFISQGTPGSIVDEWVRERGKAGGVHHMAYEVEDVEQTMAEMSAQGIEFLSDEPLSCEGLIQVFTKPSPLTSIIYEFISYTNAERRAFCRDNIKDLMESTNDLK